MPVIGSVHVNRSGPVSRNAPITWQVGLTVLLLLMGGCIPTAQPPPTLNLKLYQQWELQPGDQISGRTILGGLGDISVDLNGGPVFAPFDGKTELDQRRCVIFSSLQVPAYLFRLCGLSSPRLGELRQGEAIGTGQILQFATLRQQSNGTWAIVEPTKSILERTLKQP